MAGLQAIKPIQSSNHEGNNILNPINRYKMINIYILTN